MATSGTTAFDLDIDEIISEGYERCGISTNSGYDLRSARRSLNLLFAEWGNRGIHLWKVNLNTLALVAGQAEYSTATGVNDVLEAFISSTASNTGERTDVYITKIDRSAYAALQNKGSQEQPSQYYVERKTSPKIFLYITPDVQTFTHLKYYSINRIEDAGSYTNEADVAYRFLPCMCAGLAYYLSMKKNPQLTQQNKLIYEDELRRALEEDGQRASTFIAPQSFYPTVG